VTPAVRRLVELVSAGLMAAITGVVGFQVLTRYVLQHPVAWPEEAARYLFVWVALLGAALGVDRGVHFSLDLLTSRFPGAAARRLAAVIDLACAAFAALLAWHGTALAWRVREQPSAALEIPMAWPYAAIPVAALLMAWSLAASARRRWRGQPPA
jgi:TRAP-type C4-dicarboxylate transport system permease small subunit